MANDAIDPTDSTFEDHWDKLEISTVPQVIPNGK